MAEVVLTSAGLDYIASMLYEDVASVLYIAVGKGTPTLSGLGDEHIGFGFARAEASGSYASNRATITKTFTAVGGSVQVTEAGLYAGSVFIGYIWFGEFDLRNGGVVPDGASIPITFTLDVTAGTFTYSLDTSGVATNDPIISTYTGSASVILGGSASIDPDSFTCTTQLCFNGNPIRNGSISDRKESRGGIVWDIVGYTTNEADIESLKVYCAPMSISSTITGMMYVNSILLPGTFRIYNNSTHAYDVYTRCWISSDIAVEHFGEGYWFRFTITQDYQGTKTVGVT